MVQKAHSSGDGNQGPRRLERKYFPFINYQNKPRASALGKRWQTARGPLCPPADRLTFQSFFPKRRLKTRGNATGDHSTLTFPHPPQYSNLYRHPASPRNHTLTLSETVTFQDTFLRLLKGAPENSRFQWKYWFLETPHNNESWHDLGRLFPRTSPPALRDTDAEAGGYSFLRSAQEPVVMDFYVRFRFLDIRLGLLF